MKAKTSTRKGWVYERKDEKHMLVYGKKWKVQCDQFKEIT
jgi:hypothetical protein